MGQDGFKSGVDTPERFFFPHKQPGPLSPKAFTSALDRGLTKLSVPEHHKETSTLAQGGVTRHQGVHGPLHEDEKGQRDHIGELDSQLQTAGLGAPSKQPHEDEERPDLGTPKPGQPSQAMRAAESPDIGDERDGSDHGRRRTKAFAFYGQVCSSNTLPIVACRPDVRPIFCLSAG